MSEGTFELVIENGVLTGYTGRSKRVEIPEGVTEIGANAFKNCKFIEEVNIKSTILKTIGESAFEDCTNMKNCTLSSLKGSIEARAFAGCKSLNYIEFPNGAIKIGKDVFNSCKNLLYVAIPSTVFIIEGEIFDIDNKKTVILGEIGSEAEEYSKSNNMPFKTNTPAIRKEFDVLRNKKDNTGYKDFNIFGETVRCYKSVLVYKEILEFFRNLNIDFSNDVIKYIPNDLTRIDEKNFEKLVNLSQVNTEKVREFLQKHGVFLNDVMFEAKTIEYNANYISVCQTFSETTLKIAKSMSNDTKNLKDALIAEAESKVTGLSYGVIGDSLTLAAHAYDEYRAEKRQRKEAYAVATSKMQSGTNQIINQAQNIYEILLNDTIMPAFDKSIAYICDGLMKLAVEEMIEAKVIDKKVFEIYDVTKSKKLIEQAKENQNIDKKYAIATALKLYPLNIDAVVLAINESLIEKEFLRFIDFFDFYKDYMVILALDNKFSYLEIQSFLEKNEDILGDGFKKNIKASIKHKAKILIERINNDGDPMEIDIDTWNDLVQKHTIIDSKNIKRYKISEDEVKGPNGRELLSKAIAVARDEKHKEDLIKKQKEAEKQKKNTQKNKIKQIENQIIDAEKEIEKPKGLGQVLLSAFFALVFLIMPIFLIYAAIDLSTVLLFLFDIIMFIVMSCKTRSNLKDYRQGIEKAKQLKKQIKIWEKDLQLSNDKFENEHNERAETEGLTKLNGNKKEKRKKKNKIKIIISFILLFVIFILVLRIGIIPSIKFRDIVAISAHDSTFGVKSDGTVVSEGSSYNGVRKVTFWKDIVAISAGDDHTVGLKSDGTVVATGENDCGQCNVSNWEDIVAIATGYNHTVGLKSNGTVIATNYTEHLGHPYYGQCEVSNWEDIIAISANGSHTVGLKSDGTVVATGERDVSNWTDIVAISAGTAHTVGLKSDGTVVAIGNNASGKCNVDNWTDIVAISAGYNHTVGLKSDGTVVAVGDNDWKQCNVEKWTGIEKISAGFLYTVGLKSDGTVVAVGRNREGQCLVGW